MNELKIVVNQSVGKIDFNFEESKAVLSENLKKYTGVIITEDTVDIEKKEVTYLRGQIKVLEDARKKAKKECLKPYEEFEPKAKELVGLVEDTIKSKNDQLDVFEQKRIDTKKKLIQSIYDEVAGDISTYLPLTKIYNAKWENKGPTEKAIREEIEQVVSSVEMAVETISSMNSDSVDQALEIYKQNLSLADAISYVNKYEKQKADILLEESKRREREAERKRLAEEKRIKEEAAAKVLEEERKRVAEEKRLVKEREDHESELVRVREEAILKAETEKLVIAAIEVNEEPIFEELAPTEDDFEIEEMPFVPEEDITDIDEPSFDLDEKPFDAAKWINIAILVTDAELEDVFIQFDELGIEHKEVGLYE